MKHKTWKIKIIFVAIFLVVFFSVAAPVFAACRTGTGVWVENKNWIDCVDEITGSILNTETNYKMLEPLPKPPTGVGVAGVYASDEGGRTTFSSYLSWFYNFALAACAFLAVLQITIAGIMWIGSGTSITSVTKARAQINDALSGLALAFFSYLLLYTVNPDLVDFKLNLPSIKMSKPIGQPAYNESPAVTPNYRWEQNTLWCTNGRGEQNEVCVNYIGFPGGGTKEQYCDLPTEPKDKRAEKLKTLEDMKYECCVKHGVLGVDIVSCPGPTPLGGGGQPPPALPTGKRCVSSAITGKIDCMNGLAQFSGPYNTILECEKVCK